MLIICRWNQYQMSQVVAANAERAWISQARCQVQNIPWRGQNSYQDPWLQDSFCRPELRYTRCFHCLMAPRIWPVADDNSNCSMWAYICMFLLAFHWVESSSPSWISKHFLLHMPAWQCWISCAAHFSLHPIVHRASALWRMMHLSCLAEKLMLSDLRMAAIEEGLQMSAKCTADNRI